MSNYNSTSTSSNVIAISLPTIPHTIRFWYFLCCDILSLSCSFLTLYFLFSDRILYRAVNNHIFIVLLFIGILYELIDVSWILRNTLYDTPWQMSSTFYLFWAFFDYSIYSLQIGLFSWATIERHIIIFHEKWISSRIKRIFIHYLPIIIIITYYMTFYSIIYYSTSCNNSFNSFLQGGIYGPCLFDKLFIVNWDLVGNQIIPTLTIAISSFVLIIRVVKRKNRVNQIIRWRKYRKMTIQLVSVSCIYVVFNSPWVIIIWSVQASAISFDTFLSSMIYAKFLLYNITFLFPIVCCLSMQELRKKFKAFSNFFQQRQRIGITRTV